MPTPTEAIATARAYINEHIIDGGPRSIDATEVRSGIDKALDAIEEAVNAEVGVEFPLRVRENGDLYLDDEWLASVNALIT